MLDSVSSTDGHSYEESAILNWIQTDNMNLTGKRLLHDITQSYRESIPAIQLER